MRDLHLWKACQFPPWKHLADGRYKKRPCTDAAAAFTENIRRANALLMLPGHAFKSGMEWQKCVAGASELFYGPDEPADDHFARTQAALTDHAMSLRNKHLAERDAQGSINSFFNSCYNVEVFAKENRIVHEWLHDLLKSSVVQAWGAYEVLAEQLWSGVTVHRAGLDTRSKNEQKWSGHRSRSKIANLYKFTFRVDNADIMRCVDSPKIHALGIVRNLLVHNGGRIDGDFIKDRSGIAPLNKIRARAKGSAIHFNACQSRGRVAYFSSMTLDALPDLETICTACKGRKSAYNSEEDNYQDCPACGGSGFMPTPIGARILDLVRHNSRVTVSAELRVASSQ